MNRTARSLGQACLIVVLASPIALRAQTIDGGAYFSPITDNVQPLIHGNLFSKAWLERRGTGKPSRSPSSKSRSSGHLPGGGDTASADVDKFDWTIRFDKAVSRVALDDYLQAIARASGDKAASGLRRYYASNDARALLAQAMRPYGLRDDELSDIATAHVVVMWMTANQAAPPSQDQVGGVREQVRHALARSAELPSRASERQRVAESLIYETVTLIRVRETAQQQNNRQYLDALADSAQSSMARRAINLRGSVLTGDGMRPR